MARASPPTLVLQDKVAQLVRDEAFKSAEVLAQGLLIEAPATTATLSSRDAPLVGAGSAAQTLMLLAEALARGSHHRRALAVYKQALQLLNRTSPSLLASSSSSSSPSSASASAADPAVATTLRTLHVAVGHCHEKLGDARAALDALERVPFPDRDVALHLRMGRLHRDLGQSRQAISAYDEAWRQNPFALEAARALIDLGQRADTLLAESRDVHVSCAPWVPTLIQAYSFERHFAPREALKCLESLGAAFDTSLDCLLQKARLRLHLSEVGEASLLFERAHRLDDASVEGMDLYALCLWERRDVAKLNALARQLMNAGGTARPEPWIAAALHALVRADGNAEALAEQAVKAGPQHANAFFVKGMVLLAEKEASGAVAWFRHAKQLSPSIRTYSGLVEGYIAAEQTKLALESAREIRKAMPGEAQPLVLLGMAYYATRKGSHREKAKTAFSRALDLDPQCRVACHRLVDIWFEEEDYAQAIDRLVQILRHCETARLHARLGDAYCATQEFDNAIENYQHALALDAGCAEALAGMERAEKLIKGIDPDESMDQGDEDLDMDSGGEEY